MRIKSSYFAAKTAYELLNDDISKEVAASRILKVVRDKGEDLPGMLDDSNLSFD